jgi:hypothetical protein
MRTLILSLDLIEHRLHDRGHARHHDYIADPEARRPVNLVEDAPLGIRVRRRRASFISAPVVFTHSCKMASARGSLSIGTPNACATVMSPWVGPIPPVVKT